MAGIKKKEAKKSNEKKVNKVYDLIILGAGAAGMTCAIYAARYKLDAIVIGKETGGIANNAPDIQNWPGMIGTGLELMQKFKEHVKKFNVPIITEEITELTKEGELFKIITNANQYNAKSIVIALGTIRRKLGIPGEDAFTGRGVSYCASCDGYFFKNKSVAVVGGSNAAAINAQMLAELCKKVYLIIRKGNLTAEPARIEDLKHDKKVEIIKDSCLVKITGDKLVTGIDLDTGRHIDVDGVFIEVGGIPLSGIAKGIGVEVDEQNKRIIVKPNMATNVPGVFAAGDISTGSAGFNQVITAAAEGAIAALGVFNYVRAMKNK